MKLFQTAALLFLVALCSTCSADKQDTDSHESEEANSQLSIFWPGPNKCRFVRCVRLWCKNPIPANSARGKCCPSCPKKPRWPSWPRPAPHRCKLVPCARPICKNPIPANPARGKCCPTCPIPPVRPFPTLCKKVLCVVPTCKNPIPANPSRGRCCATCPKPPSNLGTCPAVPPGRKGICAMLCFSDGDCSLGQRCCSNGCGRQCTAVSTTNNAVCSLPKVRGYCKAYFRRYYFDKRSGKCKKFIYGGCGGNKNNFTSLRACQIKCGGFAG